MTKSASHPRLSLRWPSRSLWIAFVKCIVLIQLLWLIVYGGADFLASHHDYRVRVHLDLELAIPFWPQFAAVYLSLFPMLWLSPFVLHHEERLRGFASQLGWLILISGVGFVLFPSLPAYEPQPIAVRWQPIFEFADQVNLKYNMLPSLHVAMAVLCAATYSRHAGARATVLFWTWAFAISASTLVTHQHHIADLIAGAALAAWVGHRFARCDGPQE